MNDGQELNRRKSQKENTSCWKNPCVNGILIAVGILLVLAAGASIVFSTILPGKQLYKGEIHGVMFDAGSSKTAAWVYAWNSTSDDSTLPELNQLGSVVYKPGIASFANNISGIEPYLKQHLRYLEGVIKPEMRPTTALYFRATAGMRLLSVERQRAILKEVSRVLSSSGFYFKNEYASVIAGSEEAVYDWVGVNYQNSGFSSNSLASGSQVMSVNSNAEAPTTSALPATSQLMAFHGMTSSVDLDEMELFGALDMGGASLQIAFVPDVAPTEDKVNIELAKKKFQLLAKSYLGYGGDQFRTSFLTGLASALPATVTTVNNPCMNRGYNLTKDGEAELVLNGRTYRMNGLGDFEHCLHAVSDAFKLSSFVPPSVAPRGRFVAISSFQYLRSFFNLSATPTLNELATRCENFCQLDWNTALTRYGASNPPNLLGRYCFGCAYVETVLVQGFGFDPKSNQQLVFKDADWSKGAMVKESDVLRFYRDLPKFVTTRNGIIVVAVAGALIVLCIPSVYRAMCRCCGEKSEFEENFDVVDKKVAPVISSLTNLGPEGHRNSPLKFAKYHKGHLRV